jgi:cytochrome c oxidase subunit 2
LACAARLFAPAALLAGCDGIQSALDPAGRESEALATLFWAMLAGAAVIWAAVIGVALYAGRSGEAPRAARLCLAAGVILPTVVLAGLLLYGLKTMAALRPAGEGLTITVTGEQWWWRVVYHPAGGGEAVGSANEIRLPLGVRTELRLLAGDVIHSLWIPALAGKLDMIPGRTTRLVVEPTRTGEFRGVCAEYCGTSHALMAFPVVVMEKAAFEAWLRRQAAPAAPPATPAARRGRDLFMQVGCSGCHRVAGTPAAGSIGPDLTHLAGRRSLAAGILPNDETALRRWIAHPDEVKPEAKMPGFAVLGEADLAALVAYLAGLQ